MSTEKEQFVQRVFEDIAPDYDRMNTILSFRRHKAWRRFAMKKIDLSLGEHALDVCAGTCDWTIALAERVGPGGKVCALDFSPGMLAVGQEKVNRAGVSTQVELVEGNAMYLPFADEMFDVATIGFALRNVPDIDQVLIEMKRVIKRGGQVVSLELSQPVWAPFRAIYLLYFENVLPFLGKVLAGKYQQYHWLPESLKGFPDYCTLAQKMEEIGFRNVKVYPLAGGIAALHIGYKE